MYGRLLLQQLRLSIQGSYQIDCSLASSRTGTLRAAYQKIRGTNGRDGTVSDVICIDFIGIMIEMYHRNAHVNREVMSP